MHLRSFERSLVSALWLASFACLIAAFNTDRVNMSSVANSDAAGLSYAAAGPCRVASWRNVKLQGTTASAQMSAADSEAEVDRASQNFTIHLSISRPMGSGVAAWHAPYPVVLLMNGFQMRASFYRAYAARLASWGYVCVQYDDPLLRIIDDATEVCFKFL